MKHEEYGQMCMRFRKEGRRKPLRTLKELAEEFGMTKMALAATLTKLGGIKPILYADGKNNRNSWYEPNEVRAFMNKLKTSENYPCHTCKRELPRDQFYKNKNLGPLIMQQPCKECHKKYRNNTNSTES